MRLIDRDALPKYTGYALSANEVAMAVENAPTIDAVPVVRCGDCKYWITGNVNYCDYALGGTETKSYWYCADGERKDGVDNG